MVSLEVSKKNHEKLMTIRDEEGLKSFNEVLDKILPDGSISGMDFEQEQPAFILFNNDNGLNITWDMLKKADVGDEWENKEVATMIYKDEIGCLIRFIDSYGEVYLNYFHFLH